MQIQAGLSTSKERRAPPATFQLEHTELPRVLGVLPRHSEPISLNRTLTEIYLLTRSHLFLIYDIYTEILGAAYEAQSRDFHFGTIFAPAAFLVGV